MSEHKFPEALRDVHPEIETGCKLRRTDVHAGMWGRKLHVTGAGGTCRAKAVRAAMKNGFVTWCSFHNTQQSLIEL